MSDQVPAASAHDPGRELILEVLDRHQVQYVVIGGAACQSRGWGGLTADVDVTPSQETETSRAWRPR